MRILSIVALLGGVAAAHPIGWECDREGYDDRARGLVSACIAVRGAATFIYGTAGVTPGDQTLIATAELDALADGKATTVSRTIEIEGGHAIAETVFVMPNGDRGHARVVAEREKLEAGLCVGPADQISECEDRLTWISIAVKPHENADIDVARWATLAVLIGVVAAAGIALWKRLRRTRSLVDSQPLRDLEVVTVTGIVRGEAVTAPLSGSSCALYRARARVFSTDSVPVLVGEPVETSRAAFVVETRHGRLLVEAIPEIELEPVSTRDAAREHAFLSRHGFPARDHGATLFEEVAIPIGATVTLRGEVHLERDVSATAERGYRDEAPMVAKLTGTVTILDSWE